MRVRKITVGDRFDEIQLEDRSGLILDTETNMVHVFNAVAWAIWNILDECDSAFGVAIRLQDMVDSGTVLFDEIVTDVGNALEDMRSKGLIEIDS